MSIIAIANTKGGVGKTTIAINVAVALALAGQRVWAVDADQQGTMETAFSIRSGENFEPIIACSKFSDRKTLVPQVLHQSKNYDTTVIDVGGRDSSNLRASLALADTLVIPFQPRSFDIWALNDINSLVEEAREARQVDGNTRALQALVVLNCADVGAGAADNISAADEIATEFPRLKYIDAPIRRRKSISNAAGRGLSVLEYTPKDIKACDEIAKLVNVIFTFK